MKKIAIDSYYPNDSLCCTVGLIFYNWTDEKPDDIIRVETTKFMPYVPGQFYKRELPGILELLKCIKLQEFDTIIIDSYIDLLLDSGEIQGGLGRHLGDSLMNSKKLNNIPDVVGVAKSKFGKTGKISEAVLRGISRNPLWVQSYLGDSEAGKKIREMAGEGRIPTLLKLLDKETKKNRVGLIPTLSSL